MDKKVYSSFAFKEYGKEAYQINQQIYSELKEKYKTKQVRGIPTEQELSKYDFIYSVRVGYAHWDCTIYKAPKKLSKAELALIIDGGNLCFGYYTHGDTITISTD